MTFDDLERRKRVVAEKPHDAVVKFDTYRNVAYSMRGPPCDSAAFCLTLSCTGSTRLYSVGGGIQTLKISFIFETISQLSLVCCVLQGCFSKLSSFMENNFLMIGGVAIGFSFLQVSDIIVIIIIIAFQC